MATQKLNYASMALDEDLHQAFEKALEEARQGIADPLPNLVDGEAVREGTVFTREDPCRLGGVVSSAHEADPALVHAAVAAARSQARTWRNTPYQERVAKLRAAADEIQTLLATLAGLMSAETGKTRLEALAEAQEAVDLIEHYCAEMEANDGFVRPLASTERERNTDVLRPIGVFGVIAPFNFPVALAVNMSAGALVTGNTVVVKPSDKTPRSTYTAIEVLARHLPAGVVNLVHGGPSVGQALADAEVDGLAFTGSAKVGWSLVEKLSRGPYARPVLAEMGGQNPTVVGASADLDAAAAAIARSAFGFSGQKCSACRRVVVDASVHDDLVERLVAEAKNMVPGDPADGSTSIGPVVDQAITDRIEAALEQARQDGQVRAGGRVEREDGFWVEPVVVTDLPPGHPLTREELFAPFLTVVKADSFDEAMAEANAVDYGLSAGVFSRDDAEVERFLDEMQAGVLYVNRRSGSTTGAWPGVQSFCGWKASGSSGKGGLGHWYLPGFMREQSRTVATD